MALNDAAPYPKDFLYFMEDTGAGVMVAPGVVEGGRYRVDPDVQESEGVGGQAIARGGMVQGTTDVELTEPLEAYMTYQVRAAPARTVTAKDIHFGTDDGEWEYNDCQPDGFRFRVEVGRIPTLRVGFWSADVVQAVVGDAQEAVSSGLTDNFSDFDFLLDAVDYQAHMVEVIYNQNPFWHQSVDARAANAKRNPDSVLLDRPSIELVVGFRAQMPDATFNFTGDAIDSDIDAILAGTGPTFTYTGLTTPVEEGPVALRSGVVVWQYRFKSITPYGGLVMS